MSEAALRRLRLALAAIVVLASLLAVSAWFKDVTCGCGSSGLPWGAIALTSTIGAGVAIAAYVFVTAATRESAD